MSAGASLQYFKYHLLHRWSSTNKPAGCDYIYITQTLALHCAWCFMALRFIVRNFHAISKLIDTKITHFSSMQVWKSASNICMAVNIISEITVFIQLNWFLFKNAAVGWNRFKTDGGNDHIWFLPFTKKISSANACINKNRKKYI